MTLPPFFSEADTERVDLTAVNRRGLRDISAQQTRPGETWGVARHGYACDSPLEVVFLNAMTILLLSMDHNGESSH